MAIYGPRVPGSSCLPRVAALAPHAAAQVGRGPRGPESGVGCRTEVTLGLLPAKKYKKVTGKEIYSDTLESTAMLEKEKFPQDYFPEVGPRQGRQPSTGLGCARATLRDRTAHRTPMLSSCSAGGSTQAGSAGWPRGRAGGPVVDVSRHRHSQAEGPSPKGAGGLSLGAPSKPR